MDIKGTTTPTRDTGGTAGYLPAERKAASFDPSVLVKVFRGSNDGAQQELAKLLHADPLFDFTFGAPLVDVSRTLACLVCCCVSEVVLSERRGRLVGALGPCIRWNAAVPSGIASFRERRLMYSHSAVCTVATT